MFVWEMIQRVQKAVKAEGSKVTKQTMMLCLCNCCGKMNVCGEALSLFLPFDQTGPLFL